MKRMNVNILQKNNVYTAYCHSYSTSVTVGIFKWPLRTFIKSVFMGLQNEKAPTIGKENTEFCQSWCKILNHSSLDLMLLTVEPASKEL